MTEQEIIQKQNEILTKSAEFVNAAGPKLEKLASLEVGLTDLVKIAAASMVETGAIAKSDETKVANDIAAGGLQKIAEAFKFIVNNVNARPKTMGKSASATVQVDRPLTADEVFEARLGIS